jgi:hypothetical protein
MLNLIKIRFLGGGCWLLWSLRLNLIKSTLTLGLIMSWQQEIEFLDYSAVHCIVLI